LETVIAIEVHPVVHNECEDRYRVSKVDLKPRGCLACGCTVAKIRIVIVDQIYAIVRVSAQYRQRGIGHVQEYRVPTPVGLQLPQNQQSGITR
jgi:hypothetical protein